MFWEFLVFPKGSRSSIDAKSAGGRAEKHQVPGGMCMEHTDPATHDSQGLRVQPNNSPREASWALGVLPSMQGAEWSGHHLGPHSCYFGSLCSSALTFSQPILSPVHHFSWRGRVFREDSRWIGWQIAWWWGQPRSAFSCARTVGCARALR